MVVDGLTPGGRATRQLEVRDDPESPSGERWVIVTAIIAGTTPHSSVRVPLAKLIEAIESLGSSKPPA